MSEVLTTRRLKEIETKVVKALEASKGSIPKKIRRNPRSVGDSVQEIIVKELEKILDKDAIAYSSEFARKAMADAAFISRKYFTVYVDVKTHRIDAEFNMPNLTSVKQLAEFYRDDQNYFMLLIVSYKLSDTNELNFRSVRFTPIEKLSWECLTIGALGHGQVQIRDASNIVVDGKITRKQWMIKLANVMLTSYFPKQTKKVKEGRARFQRIKQAWESK